jgi:hypothetical protein
VRTEHQAQAAKIYNYFANKHTMRRLKDEHISEFMLAVDDLCDNRKRIDLEHVKVLVTLPQYLRTESCVRKYHEPSQKCRDYSH